MIRVGQRLKLPGARGQPRTEARIRLPGLLRNLGEKTRLRPEGSGLKADRLTGALKCGEIDVCRHIRRSGLGEDIGREAMSLVASQSTVASLRK